MCHPERSTLKACAVEEPAFALVLAITFAVLLHSNGTEHNLWRPILPLLQAEECKTTNPNNPKSIVIPKESAFPYHAEECASCGGMQDHKSQQPQKYCHSEGICFSLSCGRMRYMQRNARPQIQQPQKHCHSEGICFSLSCRGMRYMRRNAKPQIPTTPKVLSFRRNLLFLIMQRNALHAEECKTTNPNNPKSIVIPKESAFPYHAEECATCEGMQDHKSNNPKSIVIPKESAFPYHAEECASCGGMQDHKSQQPQKYCHSEGICFSLSNGGMRYMRRNARPQIPTTPKVLSFRRNLLFLIKRRNVDDCTLQITISRPPDAQ